MDKSRKEISREVGLEIGYICGKYFLKLEHLHYGYWGYGLRLDVSNLSKAQDAYSDFIFSHIPEGVKTILDVGCGTGQTAAMLIKKGYRVDCVCPSSVLVNRAKELLGDSSRIYESTFEELQIDKRYDMVMFCESFQYVDLQTAVSKTPEFLNDGGFLFICDIFRKDVEGKCPMGGGHKLGKFFGLTENAPLELKQDIDITEQTAPNMDLLEDVYKKVIKPVAEQGHRFIEASHPHILKILKWKYKNKIDKLNRKYFEEDRSGEVFKKFKSYRLFIYKKTD